MNIGTREPTRYEITARHPDGRCYLVAYSAQKSRMGLLKAMQGRGDQIVDICSITDDHEIKFATKPRVHAIVNGWIIGFTGRTQREVSTLKNEHPYIAA